MTILVDVIAGGALVGKSTEVAKALVEEITSNSCHRLSDRATSKRSNGKYEVDAMTLLANRVDALA